MLTVSKKSKGSFGEQQVVSWLRDRGYTVLNCNYFCRQGEIDIIAQRSNTVSFIEVKTRLKSYFDLSQVITPVKRKKIIAAAKNYITRYGRADHIYRFDVALVEKSADNFNINYVQNAFFGTEF